MTEKRRNILVVINTSSGNGLANRAYSPYFKFLKIRQIDFFPYFTTGQNDTDNIRKLLEHREFDTISILGGDGTNNLVMNALNHFNYTLHLIPCGTGNDLIESLSNRKNISSHFKAVIEDHQKEVDVFKCNDRRFLVSFGIGFDGAVCELMEKRRNKALPKLLRYWSAILQILFGFKEVELEIDGKAKKVFLLSLANNSRFGGGFLIAPLAEVNDKLLERVLIGPAKLIERIKHLLKVQQGNHLHLPMVEYDRVAEYSIYCKEEQPAHVDGELLHNKHFAIYFENKITVLV